MRRDLITWVCLVALVACLAQKAPGPRTQQPPPDTLDYLERVPEVHNPVCLRHRSASVEYLDPENPHQRAAIERGEVVYLALRYGGQLIPADCQADLDSGVAICPDDDFRPSPVAGESRYCRSCRASWGRHLPSLDWLLKSR